jgi:hypothetical protein
MRIPFSISIVIVSIVGILAGVIGTILDPDHAITITGFCTLAMGQVLNFFKLQYTNNKIDNIEIQTNGLSQQIADSARKEGHQQGVDDEKAREKC